jgi:Ser/Thr protein kinase RdoA (MazF antagonist)
MEPGLVDRICELFELGTPTAVRATGGTRTRSIELETTTGKWMVRERHAAYSAEERIRFDHQAAEFLNERGVSVPLPKRSRDGIRHWKHSGSVWEVHPFFVGQPLAEGDPEQIESLAAALALFHRVGRDFPLRYEKLGARGETDPRVLQGQAKQIEEECPDCLRAVGRHRGWLTFAVENLPDSLYAALPHTLVHGDPQPANLLFENNRLVAWLDLDWCGWQARLYDLCFAILFCCSTHEAPIEGENIWSLTQPPIIEPEQVGRFLDVYQAGSFALTPDESRALKPQMILSWCHARLAGAFKVPKGERLAFLDRPPEDLPSFLSGISRVP